MKNILVLTHGEDPHADSVCKYLSERGIGTFRVETERLSEAYKLTFNSEFLTYNLSNGSKEIQIDDSWNIWNRRVMNPDVRKGLSKNIVDIIFDESEKAWDGLLMSHRGKVVNRPQNHMYANNKIDQMKFVSEFGNSVLIPDTLVTNDPKKAEKFYDKHKGNICFKLHKGAIVESSEGYKIVYTNKVTKKQMKNADLISSHPCLFQEYIEKEFEVRIVATDKNHDAIAIDSQNSEISKIDYRKYDFENVSRDVKNLCSEMLKYYGLHFGVFDFIKSKDGQDVFLELNPNGQWLWLELESGHNITKSVAENLIS